MMDFPLTLPHLLRRAETLFGNGEIVTRLPDKSLHRTTYRETMRARAAARRRAAELGLERGDRVATLCWNHHQHLEAYFGIPCGGFVLHTLNLRLHPNDLAYIASHADDRAVIVDRSLLPLLEQFQRPDADRARLRRRGLVRGAARDRRSPDEWRDPELDENEAAAMCYTTGTTGQPQGRPLLAPLDRAPRARRRREQPARASASASTTRCCRSSRCSTRTRGASRTSRR